MELGGEMREQSLGRIGCRIALYTRSGMPRERSRRVSQSKNRPVEKWAVCEPPHTHARTSTLDPRQTKKEGCQMQTRRDESLAHGWPWAPDVTRALVCLMVGLLLVLASLSVPA